MNNFVGYRFGGRKIKLLFFFRTWYKNFAKHFHFFLFPAGSNSTDVSLVYIRYFNYVRDKDGVSVEESYETVSDTKPRKTVMPEEAVMIKMCTMQVRFQRWGVSVLWHRAVQVCQGQRGPLRFIHSLAFEAWSDLDIFSLMLFFYGIIYHDKTLDFFFSN